MHINGLIIVVMGILEVKLASIGERLFLIKQARIDNGLVLTGKNVIDIGDEIGVTK